MSGLLSDPHKRIILAADVPDMDALKRLLDTVGNQVGVIKIGLETHSARTIGGPAAIAAVHEAGADVMYDGKFNDIPETMRRATSALAEQDVGFFTVHASAGRTGMAAAAESKGATKMLAVTVLTSMSKIDCHEVFGDDDVSRTVLRFVRMASEAGADGIVCSPQELDLIRADPRFNHLFMVTPGVRPAWAAAGDQSRIMTPEEAIRAGADYVVVGRPVTRPPASIGSPENAINAIAEEIARGLAARAP